MSQPEKMFDATAEDLVSSEPEASATVEASISETDLVSASEIGEAPPEAGFPRPADPAAQSFLDPKTKSRIAGLDQQRLHTLKLIKAEVEKHDRAVTRIEEAQAAIAKAQQDFHNARIALATRIEQRDNALIHKAEHEDRLREINDEIRELSLTPAERKARDARREAVRRKAEAEAAAAAAQEAYDNELVEVTQTYIRQTDLRGKTTGWNIVARLTTATYASSAASSPSMKPIRPKPKLSSLRRSVTISPMSTSLNCGRMAARSSSPR